MEDKILLKKLSKKSLIKGLDYGYLENQQVSVILSVKPTALAFIYFNNEKLSFTDDILEELGIKDKYEIPKPGVNKKRGADYFMDRKRAMTDEQRMGNYNKKQKWEKGYDKLSDRIIRAKSTKGFLQMKNQGH